VPAKIGPQGDRSWICPGCRDLCSCAACRRLQVKRELKKKTRSVAENGGVISSSSSSSSSQITAAVEPLSAADATRPCPFPLTQPAEVVVGQSEFKVEPENGHTADISRVANPAMLVQISSSVNGQADHQNVHPLTESSEALIRGREMSNPSYSLSTTTPSTSYNTLLGTLFNLSPQMPVSCLSAPSPMMLNATNHLLSNSTLSSQFLSPTPSYGSLPLVFSSSPPQSPFQMNSQLPSMYAPNMASIPFAHLFSSPQHNHLAALPQMDPAQLSLFWGSINNGNGISPICWNRSLSHR